MKAVVVHQYGGPEVLKFEEYPDPVVGAGEVLVRVAATSVKTLILSREVGSGRGGVRRLRLRRLILHVERCAQRRL